jgi:hypothetical protein
MRTESVVGDTRRWIASVVIGLNLCPFARRVFEADQIRYTVTRARDEERLLTDLAAELRRLAICPPSHIETTLLIHPFVLGCFHNYNDFLDRGERLVARLGLRGTIQIAGFHPDYQFAGTDPSAVENYTNRSPYPMLHLLREESISRVATEPGALGEIPHRNIATLRDLGIGKILEKLEQLSKPAGALDADAKKRLSRRRKGQ